jgi:hypothetical protein
VWNASAGQQAQDLIRAKYTLALEAESCQRIVVRSCRGRFGYVPPTTIQQMQARSGRLGEAIVIMAGYDDVNITSGIDAVMAEANRQGVPHVIWLTYRSNVNYILPGGARARTLYSGHNAVLRQRASVYPTLHVADWDGYSAFQPQWFASDGIHINPTGTIQLGRFIRAQLDALPLGRCMAQSTTGAAYAGGTPFTPVANVGIVSKPTVVALDTRPGGRDNANRKVGAGKVNGVSVPAAVPTTATRMLVRVLAVDPCRTGRVYAATCGQDPRQGPSVAFAAGRIAAFNVVLARRGMCIYTTATTDVIVYLLGWDQAAAPPTTTTAAASSSPASGPTTAGTEPGHATATSSTPAAPTTTAPTEPPTTTTEPTATEPATTTATTLPTGSSGPPASGG